MPKVLKVFIVIVIAMGAISFMFSGQHKEVREHVKSQATQIEESTGKAVEKVPTGNDIEAKVGDKIDEHNKYVEEHQHEINQKAQEETDQWMTPHRPNN